MISIVLPIYNEEKSVTTIISRLKNVMYKIGKKYEIIAVNDGSIDKTEEILKKKIKGITVITHNRNKGYGASIKSGIKHSNYGWILIMDCDGTYQPEDITKLITHVGDYDMVVGARTGEKVHIPFFRIPAKWVLSKFANYLSETKVPDLNSGLRLFKKEIALRYWGLLPDGFSFTSTITLACITNSYDVKYIPINYFRREGKSTIHPVKDFIGFNKLLIKLALFFNPLKIFVPLSIFTFLIGIGISIYDMTIYHKIVKDITIIMVLFFSVQFFIMGLIAELITKKR